MSTPQRLARTALHAVFVASLALSAGPAAAATIIVNTLADVTGGGTGCMLRDAIEAAGTDTAQGGCTAGSGSDTIVFSVSGTITLALPLTIRSAVLIDGSGQQIVISGSDHVRVFVVHGAATLQGITVSNGDPGGVFVDGSLIVRRCVFTNNRGPYGAGIYTTRESSLTVIESTFSDNAAEFDGGAIYGLGPLRISDTAFVRNRADRGGAIAIRSERLDLFNSTLSGNAAVNGGGGIDGAVAADIVVLQSTIVGNRGRGIASNDGGHMTIDNSILAGNDGDCESMSFSGFHRNLIGDGSCSVGTGDPALHGDPVLGPLADNGGPTPTHALLAGSPAIDAGDGNVCATLVADQRGSPRSVDGDLDGAAVCDLGAYEYARLYAFSGFLTPLDNLPTVNAVKAGRAVPISFGLGGDQGLNIFAPGSPSSQRITCDSGAPVSDVEQTTTAGASTLSYDAPTDTYTYVWKTDRAWAGTCRQFVLQLADGTFHLASFRLK